MEVNFEELKGKTITEISNCEKGKDVMSITCSDGSSYQLLHYEDCCESVDIEDVDGEINDLIGTPILLAEEVSNSDENPEGVPVPEYQDSWTWTFYKLSTIKGSVTIRWYGQSNGYYSERVSFVKLK